MALARVFSVALAGVEGALVEVEADLALGLPALTIVGLPDTTVSEAKDRVRAAVLNSGEPWPQRRITVGLSPATMPKAGSGFDLPIAVAVLLASGAAPPEPLGEAVVVGELGLDGRVRPVPGVLPAVLTAVRAGYTRVVVPAENIREAALVPGADVIGVRSLAHLLAVLRGEDTPELAPRFRADTIDPGPAGLQDLCDVVGQEVGRRAVEVAAAGGHHLLLLGSPGCGKTMLAERLPSVLPPLEQEAALEVSAVHSVAGLLTAEYPLVARPPFRAPHHSASVPALVGGGSGTLRPGAASLAHHSIPKCSLRCVPGRAAIYVRISDDRDGAGLGVARQEEACREVAKRLGLQVVSVYVDNDVSASGKVRRPDYERLVADVAARSYEAVLVWHTDRLTRSPLELEGWIGAAEAGGGVPVHSVVAGQIDLTTPSGRLVARQLGSVARYEIELKADRQRAQAKQAAHQGRLKTGGHRPYGYNREVFLNADGQRRTRLVVRPDEATILQECARRALDGEPVRRIAADLNRRGVPTSTGKEWSASTMRRALCAGMRSGQREHQPLSPGGPGRKIVGPIVAAGDGSWPAILTPEQTAALRAKLMDPARRLTPAEPRRGLLTGILRCGQCGHGLVVRPKEDGVARYCCDKRPGSRRCGKTFILSPPTDEFVIGMLFAALDGVELVGEDSRAPGATEEESRLKAVIDDTEARLAELSRRRFVAEGAEQLSSVEYDAAREPLSVRLAEARRALGNLAPKRRQVETTNLPDRWEGLSLGQRRDVITAVIGGVTVGPGRRGYNRFDASRLSIHWIA